MEDLENPDESSGPEVMSYNMQSFGKPNNNFFNLELFRKYMGNRSHQPHIICLQETFLDAQQSDKSVAIRHYKLFRCDDNSRRAGVITYVRNDVKCKLILSDSDLQLLIVQVEIGNRIIDVSNCYRRQRTKYIAKPEVPRLTTKQYFNRYIEQHRLYTKADQRLLIGDFNVQTAANQMPKYVKTMCDVLNVIPTLRTPTTQKSTRCIDNQFCCPQLIKLVKSDIMFKPWEKPSSPHALICHRYRYFPSGGGSSNSFISTSSSHFNSTLYTIQEASFSDESSASSSGTTFHGNANDTRTFNNLSNNYKFLHNSLPSHKQLECGEIIIEAVVPIPIRFVENPILHSRIQLDPRIMTPQIKSNIPNDGPRKYTVPVIKQRLTIEIENKQKPHISELSNVSHFNEREDQCVLSEGVKPSLLLIEQSDTNIGKIIKNPTPPDNNVDSTGRDNTSSDAHIGHLMKDATPEDKSLGPDARNTTPHNNKIGSTLIDTVPKGVTRKDTNRSPSVADTTTQEISIGSTMKDATPQDPHMKPKTSQHEVDHCSHPDNKHTSRPETETSKARTHEKQTSTALIIRSVDSQISQNLHYSRTNRRKDPTSKISVSIHASPQFGFGSQWIKRSTRLGGRIKTTTKHEQVDFIGPKDKFTYKASMRVHENPLWKKKTGVLEGKNHLDPSQNYKRVKSKYSAGRGTKAAKKAGLNTAIDTVIYAVLATDKERPSLEQAVKTVVTGAGVGFANSVIPGGRLLTTLGTAIANDNYENLPLDLLLAAPSVIPGNPIHFEREQTQANAPLFGNDLRSDNINRISADVSVPYLTDLASVGFCYDREQIEFSRDGVETIRDATAVNAHASIGSALDASLGFSSGTETSEAVTETTEDGKSHTTQWEKQFSGQFGARIRAANRKAAYDIGSAFNEVTTTTTITNNTDGTPLSVHNNLSLKHLKKPEDNINKGLEATSHMHENYASNESNALPTEGRVERIYDEQTIVKDSKKACGWWAKSRKTEKYNIYEAEENAVHRSDREVKNELETTLTHQHVQLSGRDLHESSEETKKLIFFSSKKDEKYQKEEQRDEEVVQSKWTDKTQIISKKDGTPYDVRQTKSKNGGSEVHKIEIDYYKKIQHLDTKDQITSTVGQKETISTNRKVEGVLHPQVKTSSHKVEQVFERTEKHTEFQAPHLETTVGTTQTYGLLKNKTEVTMKIRENGADKPEEQYQIIETLGGAAQSAVSSVTSNVLNMACDPEARTTRNIRNAVLDVGVQGTIGWAHSNLSARQNSPGATVVAAVLTVAAHGVTKVTSSNSETLSIEEVLKDTVSSSAAPIVSLAANTISIIPAPLKAHADAITGLIILIGQMVQEYREEKVNLKEVTTAILREIIFLVSNSGIATFLIPGLVSLLPITPLGASVVTCIAGTAVAFALHKLRSWVTNKWQEGRNRKEYERLCKDLGVSPTADDATIDSRYRRLALHVHPDKTGCDATRFKKLTQDFKRLHQLRLRYNIQPDKAETKKIIKLLKQFLKDPMSFIRYLSGAMATSTAPTVAESPLELM